MTSPSTPRKLAVLGGGMGSLSAVMRLTEAPDWQDRHDITVYQVGWRLGGKGASGRNMSPEYHHRIEEHGVHVFFGFYTNAFRLMKACYSELNRAPGSLLRTWDEAFKGDNNVVLMEKMPGDVWVPWQFTPPGKGGEPTVDRSSPKVADCVETVSNWFFRAMSEVTTMPADKTLTLRSAQMRTGQREFGLFLTTLKIQLDEHIMQARLVAATVGDVALPDAAVGAAYGAVLGSLVTTLALSLKTYWNLFEQFIKHPLSNNEQKVRKSWLLCNFIYANLNGIYEDRLMENGVRTINGGDYRGWIVEKGFKDDRATGDSSLVRWLYDAIFCYRSGDINRPSLEAGTALLTTIRLLFTYNGHFLYKMQAGMGDIVFAPIYEVLIRRGVKFEFFHRVIELEVATNGGKSTVSRVRMERQADLVDPSLEYAPLAVITDAEKRKLPCWPAEPDYAQLKDGAALRSKLAAAEVTLEEYLPSPAGRTRVLEFGLHFHDVLLGTGVGAATSICRHLIAKFPPWKTMVSQVGTVATLGVQFWLDRKLGALSPPSSPLHTPAVLCGYDYDAVPIDSYADMTQVLAREDWPKGPGTPCSIAYWCSPLNDALPTLGAAGSHSVKNLASTLLAHHIQPIWPLAVAAGSFDWDRLVDRRPLPGSGAARLDAQYFVGVANPSDRYVTSFVGSAAHRLWSDESGVANLTLTGDWISNTLDIGCIEATVMSGWQAANVLLGRPREHGIAGWGVL